MGFCVTSFGYVSAETIKFAATRTAATIKSVVAVAQFSLNAYDAVKNYKKLSDISSRGIAIEEQEFGHVRDTYWPQENAFLDEFTQTTPWDTQAVLAKRYAGKMWVPVANAYAKRFKELECNKVRYCGTSYKRTLQEMLVARSTARANIESLADRIAFYEIEQIRETDFERKKQAITLRKGLIAQAVALMQSAAAGLASAGADAMSQANQALRGIGYFTEQYRQADRQTRESAARDMTGLNQAERDALASSYGVTGDAVSSFSGGFDNAGSWSSLENPTTSSPPTDFQTSDVSTVNSMSTAPWGWADGGLSSDAMADWTSSSGNIGDK